jgi:hypothetical protein
MVKDLVYSCCLNYSLYIVFSIFTVDTFLPSRYAFILGTILIGASSFSLEITVL